MAKLEPLGPNVKIKEDRGAQLATFVVRVTDESGAPIREEAITFAVVDPEGTDTGFTVPDLPDPIGSSWGITSETGIAYVMEPLKLGPRPGNVKVRAYASYVGEDPHGDFEIEIAKEIPDKVALEKGGGAGV